MIGEYSPGWNGLFERKGLNDTWLGADGIYSLSLDGNDGMNSDSENTLFIFSDTIIGSSDENGMVSDESMPNHTAAVLNGSLPDNNKMKFIYGTSADCSDRGNLFHRDLWLFDMLYHDGKVYIIAFAHDSTWKPSEVDLITVPVKDGLPLLSSYTVRKNISPFLFRAENYHYVFGMAVLPYNDADDYIYIYGYRDSLREGSRKDLIVSRIKSDAFPDMCYVEYYNGSGWTDDISDCAPVLDNVSCEMSVSPVPCGRHKGRYIAVYTENVQSDRIMYALSDTPYGPFDAPVQIYVCPEAHRSPLGDDKSGKMYTYNAKAHPHLSQGSKLLISYNVNVLRNGMAQNTDDYHPRFITLDLETI